jgi:hypothetical protein
MLRSHLEQVLNVPERVRLRPVLRLRPCWKNFLSILREAVLIRRAGIVFQPLDINLCE